MERTQSEQALDLKPGSRGRKNHDGTTETIKILPIKEGSAEVMKLLRRAEAAKVASNEAFDALAERSGTNATVLKKLFKASLKGDFAEQRQKVDQASILFEQVGEIAGGANGAE